MYFFKLLTSLIINFPTLHAVTSVASESLSKLYSIDMNCEMIVVDGGMEYVM
jgi:hypothetical protein